MYVPRVAYGGQRITLGPQIPPCLEQGLLLVTATNNRLAGPGASGILLSPLTHWHIRHTVQTHNTAPGTPCRHTLTAAPGTVCRHTLPHQAHCTDTGCHTRHTVKTHIHCCTRHTMQTHTAASGMHHGAGDSNSSLHVCIKLFFHGAVSPALNQDIFRFPRCDSFTPDKFL